MFIILLVFLTLPLELTFLKLSVFVLLLGGGLGWLGGRDGGGAIGWFSGRDGGGADGCGAIGWFGGRDGGGADGSFVLSF